MSEVAGRDEDEAKRNRFRPILGQAASMAVLAAFFIGSYSYMVVSGNPLFLWGALDRFSHIPAVTIGIIVLFVVIFIMSAALTLFPDDMIEESRSDDTEWSVSFIRTYFAVLTFGFGTLALAVALLLLQQNGWKFSGPEGTEGLATARQVALLPAWHVLEVAPFVDVNGTVGWEEPAGYTQPFIGVLLLILKLGVVLVVVEGIRGALRKLRS